MDEQPVQAPQPTGTNRTFGNMINEKLDAKKKKHSGWEGVK